MLTKRTSDLAGQIALIFEKTESQGTGEVITLGGFILSLILLSLILLSLIVLSLIVLSLIVLSLIVEPYCPEVCCPGGY